MSTIGANVQWTPAVRASRAAIAAERSASFVSQLEASASGIGNTVR